MTGHQDDRSHGCAACRDQLRAAGAAELEADQARDQNRRAGHQCRGSAQDRQRAGRDRVHHVRQERRQRALIGKPPREVFAGGEEVQLVAVVAVAAGEREQENGDDGPEGKQRPDRQAPVFVPLLNLRDGIAL